MDNQEIIQFLNTLDLTVYKHASNIIAKYKAKNHSKSQEDALPVIANEYYKFISKNIALVGYSDETPTTIVIDTQGYDYRRYIFH